VRRRREKVVNKEGCGREKSGRLIETPDNLGREWDNTTWYN
jgi:hypothetical protein